MKVTGSLFIDPHHLVFHESKHWLQLSLSVPVEYLLFPAESGTCFFHIVRYQLFFTVQIFTVSGTCFYSQCLVPAFTHGVRYILFYQFSSTSVVEDEPTWVAKKVEMKAELQLQVVQG